MTELRKRYCLLLILFVVFGVYYPAIFAPFNTVDDLKMVQGLLNDDSFSLERIFLPGIRGYYYRPLIHLSFWADKSLWGLEQSFMHLENVLLHAGNALLVFLIGVRLARRQQMAGNLAPLCAALLFAAHPVNTEAVNWISGRTDPLAALFVLLSFLLLTISLEEKRPLLALCAALSMTVGCLAKETAIFFLPAALFAIYCHEPEGEGVRERLLPRIWHYLSFLAAAAGYFLLRSLAFSGGDSGIGDAAKGVATGQAHHLDTLRIVVKVTGFYAKKLFVPWPLNFAIVRVPEYYLIPGIAVLLWALYLVAKRRGVGSVLFLSALFLASSALIVALSSMAWTPIGERYLYLASAPFALGVVFVAAPQVARRNLSRAALPAAFLLLAGFAWSSAARTVVWQDNLTLFTDAVQKSPDFPAAKNELALALADHGKSAEAFKILLGNHGESLKNGELSGLNRGEVLRAKGDLEGSRGEFLKLLPHPGKQKIQILKSLLAVNQLRAQGAPREKRGAIWREMVGQLEALQAETGDPFCYYRMGQLSLQLGEKKEAQGYFARAYREAPEGAYYKAPAKRLAERV